MIDRVRIYHESLRAQLATDAKNGRPLTAESLSHMMQQAWEELEHHANNEADAWAKRKGLI